MQHNQHIAELGPILAAAGIREVIICPGSRNAPLIQLFTTNNSFNCHSIVDERSAGYIALGMARQLKQPVAVVTTSGTAVMNLAPAVAEAQYQKIPLIILSADRPLEDVPQFNNQVIDQIEPFSNNAKAFLQLPNEVRDREDLVLLCNRMNELIHSSGVFPCGPVHINIPLRDPLYEPLPEPLIIDPGIQYSGQDGETAGLIYDPISPGRKILILAGMQAPDKKICTLMKEILSRGQVAVVAENIANMHSDEFISNPELVIPGAGEEELGRLAPDVVIAFGGQVVSKSMKLFLQDLDSIETIVVDRDPVKALEQLLESGIETTSEFENTYQSLWKEIELRSRTRAGRFLDVADFCNLTSIQSILDAVPAGSVMHLGNSSTVRYSQMFPMRQDLTYFSNRGTSGIDGSVSAAVGAAMVSQDLHVLVLGDLSFVYDSNALWNKDFPENLRIVVLNDAGGGIFRLLNGPDRMGFFEEFSVTHHPVSLELISLAFGRSFCRAGNREDLEVLSNRIFQEGPGYSILEVDTTHSENSTIFKQFKKSIS